MEPTSEQELKQLLEEGKITEEDYHQLLEAIHQKDKPQDTPEKPMQAKPRTGFGKAALILMTAGILLPIAAIAATLLLNTIGIRFKMFLFMPFFFIGILCELLAFIFGIISWKTTGGKIAALGVPCMGFLAVIVLPILMVLLPRFSYVEESGRHLIYHQTYPLDSMEGVLTEDGVVFDERISSDGKGSLRIQTTSPDKTVVRLFETGPMGIENKMLIYSAKLRTEKLNGKAYLEMWCDIPGKGEYFSRSLAQLVTGTTEWTTVQTPFRLESGQMPTNVKLNLVIEGMGTVWLDDIKLSSSPLN